MRTLDNNQKYHFLLTYHTSTLVRWYNKYICDPYGDYKEQTIRDFTDEGENAIKQALCLENFVNACKHPNTKIVSNDLYICVTGGENPYIISFSTFEDFLNAITKEDKEGFMEWLTDELLEDLENERIEEQKEWAELDKKEDETEEDWLDHAHEVLDAYFPEIDSEIRATFACEYWQNGNTDEKNLKDFEQYIKDGQN